jgi:hypothetical protein
LRHFEGLGSSRKLHDDGARQFINDPEARNNTKRARLRWSGRHAKTAVPERLDMGGVQRTA